MAATRSLRITQVAVDQLSPADYNPRQMSEAEMAKLMRSIQEFGFVEPLVVRRADNTVIGGHQRLAAAMALGMKTVPVVYVDVTEEQAKALSLALNKVQGEWDLPKLGELLEELRDLPDLDETLSGFDEQEMDQILADLERQQLPPPHEESFDLAAEMLQAQRESAPTRVSLGETWQLGRHRLLCGDSLAPGSLAPLVDTALRTSRPGVFAAGNLLHPVDTADVAAPDGRHVAGQVAAFLGGKRPSDSGIRLLAEPPLRWVAPGIIRPGDPAPARNRLLLWADDYFRRPEIVATQDGRIVARTYVRWPASPGRVFRLPSKILADADPHGGPITLALHGN